MIGTPAASAIFQKPIRQRATCVRVPSGAIPTQQTLAVAQQRRQLVQHVAAGVGMRGDAAVAAQDRAEQRDPEQHVLAEDADVDAHRGRGEIHPERRPSWTSAARR